MVAWTASRNDIHLPTLSNRLPMDIDMGEMVISMSKTYESQSIRASLFDMRSSSAIEIMLGSMVVIKNTCE